MVGRLYVCPIIGTGTDDDPQRGAIADVPGLFSYRGTLATDPSTGRTTLPWAVCWVEMVNDDWTAVDADGRFFNLSVERLSDPPANRVTNEVIRQGAMARPEANSYTTLFSLVDALVRKHYARIGLREVFPEVDTL